MGWPIDGQIEIFFTHKTRSKYQLATEDWTVDALEMLKRIAQRTVDSGMASESRVVVG